MGLQPKLWAPVAGALWLVLADTPSAQTTQRDDDIEHLRQQLERRGDAIAELLRRIETLERRLPDGPDPGTSQTRESPAVPTPDPPAPSPPEPSVTASPGSSGPGRLEVDEEAAERALERTLVETGALLLDPGQAEIAVRLAFQRIDGSTPVTVIANGDPALAALERRREMLEGAMGLRFGLPADSQLELNLPYRRVEETEAIRVGFQPSATARRSGSGWGDLRLAFAKTLVREAGVRPDLVARVAWNTGTGKRRTGDVALGGGFPAFEGELTAAKRLDPLVVVGSISAATFRVRDRIEPGDQYAFSLGTFLAVSPEAALRLSLQQAHAEEIKLNGSRLPGSDRLAAILTTGVSVILGRRLLLDVAADVGVTEDAPDYTLRVNLSRRVDTPWR